MVRKKTDVAATATQNPGEQLLAAALELKAKGVNFVEAQNALYGPGGPYARLFPTRESRAAFAGTTEHEAIHKIVGELPLPAVSGDRQATATISVRLPKTIHAALTLESRNEGVSLNQLIVSKLAIQLRAAVQ